MSDDQRFYDFLKQRIGLDVASVGLAIIERAVRQRCLALNMPDNDHYWQRLTCSHDEQQALIDGFAINVQDRQWLVYCALGGHVHEDLPEVDAGTGFSLLDFHIEAA